MKTFAATWALIVGFAAVALCQEPAEKYLATVYGRKLSSANQEGLNGKVFEALKNHFCEANRVKVSEQEVAAHEAEQRAFSTKEAARWRKERQELIENLKGESLTPAEREKQQKLLNLNESLLRHEEQEAQEEKRDPETAKKVRREVHSQFLKIYKFNQALYAKYGGRVAFQQVGPEPVDAFARFIEEEDKKDAFQFSGEASKEAFTKVFTEGNHFYMSEADGRKAMTTAWWMDETGAKK